jgi:predicted AlkP superfamily phosphohydrolase/phosphomutase/tetratricopeptide (TPR) repeat protein
MPRRKLLLVGWDAADWKVIQPLLDAGKMPTIQRLIQNGTRGHIATLHPPLSPMLWTSIATGKRPFKHGIHGFSEPTEDATGVQPITNLSRTTKALWNILNQNDLRSLVVGWWPSHPSEPINGVMVSDRYPHAAGPMEEGWPLSPGTVHPPELADTLACLRMHPDLLTAEMIEPFIPLAQEIDQDQDKRLAGCLRALAECMSIHSAASWLAEHRQWDFCAVYFEALDHFCHGFMKYHPPRQPWIGERDFELYHNIVAMAYQFHDRLLGELLEKAGPATTVVLLSDHGFHPDHLRPARIPDIPAGPAVEHRDLGVVLISGPGIKKDAVLHGASILDIAPTILTLYGLTVGEDMDGKVLSQAFVDAPDVAFIPSWDQVPGADGCHPPHRRLDPVGAHQVLEQMIALGYIERPDEDAEVAVRKTIQELRYNLGEAYQDAGRYIEAHAIFVELHAADPADQRFALRLFACCQALGMLEDMRGIIDRIDAPRQVIDYLEAQLLTAEKRYAEALERLPNAPALSAQAADLHLHLGHWQQAEELYQNALTFDPDNAAAYLGLGRVALKRRKFSAATEFALDGLQRAYSDPSAHFLLGRSLTGLKEYNRAAEAFRAALALNPNFPEAHLQLAALLEKHLDDGDSAREHRRLAHLMG